MSTSVTVSINKGEPYRVSISNIGGILMCRVSLNDATVWIDDADDGLRIAEQLAQACRAIKAGPVGTEGDDGQLHEAKLMRDHLVDCTESEATDAQRQAYDAEFGEPAVRAVLDAHADWDRVAATGAF